MSMACRVFIDSNVLFAAMLPSSVVSRQILALGAARAIALLISEQVDVELKRNLAAKAPDVAHLYPEVLEVAHVEIVPNPFRIMSPGQFLKLVGTPPVG